MAWNEWDIYVEPETTFACYRSDSHEWSDSEYVPIIERGAEEYDGPYTLTPTNAVQTIGTQGKLMLGDMTVNPIPSNYGLITWDGSTITVS